MQMNRREKRFGIFLQQTFNKVSYDNFEFSLYPESFVALRISNQKMSAQVYECKIVSNKRDIYKV